MKVTSRSLLAAAVVALVATSIAALAFVTGTRVAPAAVPTPAPAVVTGPRLEATRVVDGLTFPWDLTWVGDLLLYDLRGGEVWSKRGDAAPQQVSLPLPRIFNKLQSGLTAMVADPAAATNGYFYTCMAVAKPNGKPKGVEVWKWRLTSDTTAEKVTELVTGMPLTGGFHTGCRLRFTDDDTLYIGTGDAADTSTPQDLDSLGGKILRVRSDGTIPRDNPFYARGGDARYVWTYGHRNVQGLAVQPGTGTLWAAEQGTTRDDEINMVGRGKNYGWAPHGATYTDSEPMTDNKNYPDAVRAKWSSGKPTTAACGATFLTGPQWGAWQGWLALGLLQGEGIRFYSVDDDQIVQQEELFSGYGRTRTVQQGPDGALWFTTSNGEDDGIYRVTAP